MKIIKIIIAGIGGVGGYFGGLLAKAFAEQKNLLGKRFLSKEMPWLIGVFRKIGDRK